MTKSNTVEALQADLAAAQDTITRLEALLAQNSSPNTAQSTVDVDAMAYRFWSIHPKDIPDPVGMPTNYPGGARAWYYATEIRTAFGLTPQSPTI